MPSLPSSLLLDATTENYPKMDNKASHQQDAKRYNARMLTLPCKAFQLHDDFHGVEVHVAIKVSDSYVTYSSSPNLIESLKPV